MLHLKLAELKDEECVVKILRSLYDNSIYSSISTFDEKYVRELFRKSFNQKSNEVCTVLLKENEETIGLVSMSTAPVTFSKDKVGVELALWVLPEKKTMSSYKKLIEAYYYWAKLVGCKFAYLGKFKDNKTPERVYLRRL